MILNGVSFDEETQIFNATKEAKVNVDERGNVQLESEKTYPLDDVHYFEVEILKSNDEKPLVAIGFARKGHKNGMTGWYEHSIGFHADDSRVYDYNPRGTLDLGRKSKVGDVIGALWCKKTGIIVFSHNGQLLSRSKFCRSFRGECSDFLPTVSCSYNRGLEFRINFKVEECRITEQKLQNLLKSIRETKFRYLTHNISWIHNTRFQSSFSMSQKETSVFQILGDTILGESGIHYFEIEFLYGDDVDFPGLEIGFARRGLKGSMAGNKDRKFSDSVCLVSSKEVGKPKTTHVYDPSNYDGPTFYYPIGFKDIKYGDNLGVLWDRKTTGLILFFVNGKCYGKSGFGYSPPFRSLKYGHHDLLPTVTLKRGPLIQFYLQDQCKYLSRYYAYGKDLYEKYLERLKIERFRLGPGVRMNHSGEIDADICPFSDTEINEHKNARACLQFLGDTTTRRGIHYFEIEIIDSGQNDQPVIGIGFARLGMVTPRISNNGGITKIKENGMVGWLDRSIGMHGDDGGIFDSNGTPFVLIDPKVYEDRKKFVDCTTGKIMGALWDENAGIVQFSIGSKYDGVGILKHFAFPRSRRNDGVLVPTVTLRWERGVLFRIRVGDETILKTDDLIKFLEMRGK